MKVLALHNLKGGVGKTTSAVNLAWLAARDGHRTLLWDLDPQASSTYYLRVRPRVASPVERLVSARAEEDLARHVRGSDFELLDLLPADFSYRKLERLMAGLDDPAERMRRLLAPFAAEYDVVVLDCAPGAGALAEAVFGASDFLVVPTIPTSLSLRTLARLVKQLKKRPRPVATVLPFFSMSDPRKAMHRRVMRFCDEERLGFLETTVPYSGTAEQMGYRRAPIGVFAPRSKPALAFEALWRELAEHVWSGRNGAPKLGAGARKILERIARGGTERDAAGGPEPGPRGFGP